MATFFISLFVLLMQFLWKYIDYLAGKGLEWTVIAELLIYASANLIPMALPISVLLSSLMTFGTLAENYELVVFKTAGVPLIRIMRPLIITALIISTCALLFTNFALPKANLKFKSLLWDIREKKPTMDIAEGIFYNGLEGYSIRVNEKDLDNDILRDVIIYDHSEGRGNVLVTRAEEGTMKVTDDGHFMILDLKRGVRYHEMPEGKGHSVETHPHTQLKFERYEIKFDLTSFNFERSKEEMWKSSATMLNLSQLNVFIDSARYEIERRHALLKNFIKPYFTTLRDSNFAYSDSILQLSIVDTSYAATLKDVSGTQLINRATSHARSVKGSLRSNVAEVEHQNWRLVRGRIEWHRKFAISFACLFLFFIGAPLGAIIRKGGLGLPVVVSTILFVLFYIVMISGEKSAKQEAIDAAWGMWYPIIFLIPFGAFLTYKANQESRLVGIGAFFKKIGGIFKAKKEA